MLDYKSDMDKDAVDLKKHLKLPEYESYGTMVPMDLQIKPVDVFIIKGAI